MDLQKRTVSEDNNSISPKDMDNSHSNSTDNWSSTTLRSGESLNLSKVSSDNTFKNTSYESENKVKSEYREKENGGIKRQTRKFKSFSSLNIFDPR